MIATDFTDKRVKESFSSSVMPEYKQELYDCDVAFFFRKDGKIIVIKDKINGNAHRTFSNISDLYIEGLIWILPPDEIVKLRKEGFLKNGRKNVG